MSRSIMWTTSTDRPARRPVRGTGSWVGGGSVPSLRSRTGRPFRYRSSTACCSAGWRSAPGRPGWVDSTSYEASRKPPPAERSSRSSPHARSLAMFPVARSASRISRTPCAQSESPADPRTTKPCLSSTNSEPPPLAALRRIRNYRRHCGMCPRSRRLPRSGPIGLLPPSSAHEIRAASAAEGTLGGGEWPSHR